MTVTRWRAHGIIPGPTGTPVSRWRPRRQLGARGPPAPGDWDLPGTHRRKASGLGPEHRPGEARQVQSESTAPGWPAQNRKPRSARRKALGIIPGTAGTPGFKWNPCGGSAMRLAFTRKERLGWAAGPWDSDPALPRAHQGQGPRRRRTRYLTPPDRCRLIRVRDTDCQSEVRMAEPRQNQRPSWYANHSTLEEPSECKDAGLQRARARTRSGPGGGAARRMAGSGPAHSLRFACTAPGDSRT